MLKADTFNRCGGPDTISQRNEAELIAHGIDEDAFGIGILADLACAAYTSPHIFTGATP